MQLFFRLLPLSLAFFSETTSTTVGDDVIYTVSTEWRYTLTGLGVTLTLIGIILGWKYLKHVPRLLFKLLGFRAPRRNLRASDTPPRTLNVYRELIAFIGLIAGPLILIGVVPPTIYGNTVVKNDRFIVNKFSLWKGFSSEEFLYSSIRNLEVDRKYNIRNRTTTHTLILQTTEGEKRMTMNLELKAAIPLIKEKYHAAPTPQAR